MRFGVPDFKIEKRVVQRRVQQLVDEGVELRCGVDVGRDLTVGELRDALRRGGDRDRLARAARPAGPGPRAAGVHFAMDYLYQRNRSSPRAGPAPTAPRPGPTSEITAAGKHVVVIGGGDTGADCVGNALREGAASIVQLELLPEPPTRRPDDRTPWPQWPLKYRLSYAMEEAREEGVGEQDYAVHDDALQRRRGRRGRRLCTSPSAEPAPPFAPVEGTERELPAQLVLLAMGFLHPEQELLDQLGVERTRAAT